MATVLKLKPLVEAVKKECDAYDAKVWEEQKKLSLEGQVCHFTQVTLETQRKLLTAMTELRLAVQDLRETRAEERYTTQLRDNMFMIQRINEKLIKIGESPLTFRPWPDPERKE